LKLAQIVRLTLAGLVACAVTVPLVTNAQSPARKIRVIYTTDTLGYLEPCG
jgi:hypothetical protein